jgi:flavorubredoxin
METAISEIADGIFRLSTFVPDIAPPQGFTFNQFLIRGDEPMLFHTGLRLMFPMIHSAVSKLISVERLRWVAFGHVEAEVAHGQTACMVSVNDMADRAPRQLADGEAIDLGGKRVRYRDTPHIPHGWEAGVLYEENTRTLLCGDLFTQTGNGPALTESDIVGPAIAAEDMFKYSSLNPGMGATIRKLAEFSPLTLALMHGPSYKGDGAAALHALADSYDRRVIDSVNAAGLMQHDREAA